MSDRREQDKAFILNPDLWPHWPVLPVKRFDATRKGPTNALIYDPGLVNQPPDMPLFSLGNMWEGKLADFFESAKPRPIDEILDEGWQVD